MKLKPYQPVAGVWTVYDEDKSRNKFIREPDGSASQWPTREAAMAYIADRERKRNNDRR